MALLSVLLLLAIIYWLLVYGTDIYHKYVVSPKLLSPSSSSKQPRAVLVTGCDSGFGNITAKKMSELGLKVFAGCLSQSAADLLVKEDNRIVAFQMDVTKREDIQRAYEIVSRKIDDKEGLWAVVNNAGIGHSAPFDWQEVADVERVMQVNFVAGLHVLKTFLPLVKKARGRIVGVASVLGFTPVFGAAGYCASKHAVEGFYGALRQELMGFGVEVSLIEPGAFRTAILSTASAVATKFWNSTSAQIREQYGQEFAEAYFKHLDDPFNMASDPAEVRDAIITAVLSQSPRYHYPVGRDMYLWNNVLRWWPARSRDFFFLKVLRRGKLPPYRAALVSQKN